MPRINGVKGAYLQPPRYGRNESGPYTLYTYEGSKNELLSSVSTIESLGGLWEMQESFSGAKCVLTVRYGVNAQGGTAEVPVETWQLGAASVEKYILNADAPRISAFSRAVREHLKQSVEGNGIPALYNAGDPTNSDLSELYDLMLEGVTSAVQFCPHLSHTMTVSTNWTVKAALTNVKRIISTASLPALESIPNTVLFNLPNDVSTKPGLSYGWLKGYPEVQYGAWNKIQIRREWTYGLWATIIYGAVL